MAVELLDKAVAAGEHAACNTAALVLATVLEAGMAGVARDLGRAAQLYRAAAARGDRLAASSLARLEPKPSHENAPKPAATGRRLSWLARSAPQTPQAPQAPQTPPAPAAPAPAPAPAKLKIKKPPLKPVKPTLKPSAKPKRSPPLQAPPPVEQRQFRGARHVKHLERAIAEAEDYYGDEATDEAAHAISALGGNSQGSSLGSTLGGATPPAPAAAPKEQPGEPVPPAVPSVANAVTGRAVALADSPETPPQTLERPRVADADALRTAVSARGPPANCFQRALVTSSHSPWLRSSRRGSARACT